jgi:hypothetical protein
MMLSRTHRGSSKGYELIKSIEKKAKEGMATRSGNAGDVTVKYVLVSPTGGRWKLPINGWELCEGDVYYLFVSDKPSFGQ